MGFQQIVNLLDMTSDDKDSPRFVTKKWIEVYDQSGKDHRVNKEIRIKNQCYDQIYVILVMRILL